MTSDKAGAALLADIFVKKGLKHIVISPGSRNAPLVVAFAQHFSIHALSIVDERSAAYFALGIAQQTRKTVAITCTSGGAALNYAPAIAEAFYQKVPLLVITADRPEELIDNGDGQTIRQKNVYTNYIKASYEIPGEIESGKELKEISQLIDEAINSTLSPDCGPVQINIPFKEPLYNQSEDKSFEYPTSNPDSNSQTISPDELANFAERWSRFSKKLLIAGMMNPDPGLKKALKNIVTDNSVVLLTETTSNLNGDDCSCSCIDKVVNTLSHQEKEIFKPELLVTFGGHIISKMVKAFLRKYKPVEHWHIDLADVRMNTFKSLTHGIKMQPTDFFNQLQPLIQKTDSNYQDLWKVRKKRSEERHQVFLASSEFSDLKVFETILEALPSNSCVQLGNSTPVRYVQLFKPVNNHVYYSNRGTSGIDGTISTAAGAAFINDTPTTIITGDLGFFYDSNALMNHHLTGNLRILIINNGGGGIFRFIPGPDSTAQLEEYFEARHHWTAEYIAKSFNVPYLVSHDSESLNLMLSKFYAPQKNDRPAILEIFTPVEKNARILKSYFNYLQE